MSLSIQHFFNINIYMIQIQKLHKSYDDVIALNGIDLTIREGAITGFLGPNGAGKTTLVSILTGIIKKNSGQVSINGMDLDRDLNEIKSISSIVPQSLAFYPLLTAYENLEYFGVLYGLSGKKLRDRIDFSIEVASLQPFIKKRTGKFSGGMQRRLNLAIGLLNDPKVLYLDEPTVGVDAQSRKYMLEMIRKINLEHHTTILYASHYMNEIEQVTDEVVIIDNGSIVLNDTTQAILSSGSTMIIQVDKVPDSLKERLQGLQGIQATLDSILIDRTDMFYSNFIQVLTLLRDSRLIILNMNYNSNKLEEIYLHVTSGQIRDDE
jgi:ABC-2 type transport system ATP-binding protein